MDYSQGDSLFMHADTLQMYTYYLNTDSMFRETRAYHKVRMYRTDVQGVCDSLVFSSKDSCLTMYYDPILWNNNQQLLGEKIMIYMNDSTIDWAHIQNQALSVEQLDSTSYNQVTGKEMKKYYRPPQGKYSESNLKMASDMGYKTVFWSLAYVDWLQDQQPTREEALNLLNKRIHPQAIVLLHSTSQTNAAILDSLLTRWEEMGYSFGEISELFTAG